MAKRQRDWARRTRAKLIELLGGRCVKCGTTENLTFDCKNPMGDRHHNIEWSARMSFYRQQFTAGNLQLLCNTDNARKGDSVQPF